MRACSTAGAVLLLAIALDGLVLMGVGVVKILSGLVLELRARRLQPEPIDEELLEHLLDVAAPR